MSIIRLKVVVEDILATLALYDRIQVFRSTSGRSGSYSEITAATEQSAVLAGTASAPFTLAGQTLDISLSGADAVPTTFAGPDPMNIEAVVATVNAAMPSPIAAPLPSSTSKLQLTNPLQNTGSSILVSGGAASILGLSTSKVNGRSARILMGNMVSSYGFMDLDGDATFWYKTRFYSSLTGATSGFATPQQGAPSLVLDPTQLVKVTVDLSDITGAPIVGRRIIIVAVALQQVTNADVDYGLLPSGDRIELTTNESGHAETSLVIGSTIRVFFEGSGYARECVIPELVSPATSLDLLVILSTQPDPFSIVQAPPMPIREG